MSEKKKKNDNKKHIEEVQKLKEEKDELKKEIEDFKKSLQEKNENIENLKKTLNEKTNENEELKISLENKNKDEEKLISTLKYLQADFENFKKRVQKEKEEFSKFCNEKLIISLIPIFEDLERAFNSLKEIKNENLLYGIKIIYDEFKNILSKEGFEEIKTIGEQFNPYLHEALIQKVNNEVEEGKILQEIQRGYILNGKVIRPAKVVVSKKGEEIVKKEKEEILLYEKNKK